MPLRYLPEWEKHILEYLQKHLTCSKDICLADIGIGYSTNTLRKLGFRPIIIDQCILNEIEQQRCINYQCNLCQTIPIELTNKCDVIVCCDVLEHAINPFKMISNLSLMLKDGGKIILIIPSIDLGYHSMQPRCGDYWRFLPQSIEMLIIDTTLHITHKQWYKHPDHTISFLGGIATLRKGDKQ